jgi:hypothetical protein
MNHDRRDRILSLRSPKTDDDVREFVALIQTFKNTLNLDDVRVLMKTFTGEDDYGVHECVVSILESIDRHIYFQALLEELPRLIRDTPGWAESLVGIAINFHPEDMAKAYHSANLENRRVLLDYISMEPFISEYPKALILLKLLK